jgi:ferredoxin
MKKIRVCCSKSCTSFGAKRVMKKIEKEAGLQSGEKNEEMDLDFCGCLGYCSRSPNIEIDDNHIVFSTSVETVMDDLAEGGEDMTGSELSIETNSEKLEQQLESDFLGDIDIEPMTEEQPKDKLQEAFPDVKIPDDLPEELSEGIRKGGKIRRIVVDRQGCIGAQSCVVVAPGVFQMDDENLAYVVDPDSEDEDTILMAAQSCPTLAIHLYEADGTKIFPEE